MESAPLLAEGNTRQCFPKINEQDCSNRVHWDTTFLSYFRITLMGRQISSSYSAPVSGSLTSIRQWFNRPVLAQQTGLTHVLARHLLISSYVHCNIVLGNLKFTGKILPVSIILALLWVGISGRLVAQTMGGRGVNRCNPEEKAMNLGPAVKGVALLLIWSQPGRDQKW